jgi:class 3 adenylate cyclase/predicted ATPase
MQQVADWLEKLGLGQYAQRFAENDISFSVLPDLTDQDLKDIGVSLGYRRLLLRAIAELGDAGKAVQRTAASAEAASSTTSRDTAERRQVTVMFSDLVGSTALSARMDPEDLREIISAYQRCVAEAVERFGGFVAKYMGDGALVYFGYPQAHEDDAERAVRAALELIQAVSRLNSSAPLQTRVGIATGLVVVGDLVGSGEAQERGIVGETPNLAARLQGIAEPNMIVIAETTSKLLGNLFDLQDLGAKDLKGIVGAVRASAVLRPSTVESRLEALRTATTPLVGRNEEIDLLLRLWEQAKQGDGCVALISGEPGIGKSRLVETIVERLGGEAHTRLRYFCSPHHQDSALYPTITQLERAAGFRREDKGEQRLEKLEAVLAQGMDDLDQVVPLLADLLSIPPSDRYLPLDLTPQKRKEKTLQALVAQLEGLAARQPVLMVWEDVHWSDPTTREALDLIVSRVPGLRLLVIITFRPEFSAPWVGRPQVRLINLGRLGPPQGEQVIALVAGGKTLPKEITEQIIDRTDGVPLFIEELTKTVIESGVVIEAADHYAKSGTMAPTVIPATLQASLIARLDRLAPTREVAQIGAALGRQFSHDLITAVANMPQQRVEDALVQLGDAGLIFRRGSPPDAEYTFKHALVRDAAYETLLRSSRQRLHAHIAGVIEKRFPEIATATPETLAHHFTAASLASMAIPYWLKAGQHALQRSTLAEAITHLSTGLTLITSITDEKLRIDLELGLQATLGLALTAAKGYAVPEVEKAYTRARELCNLVGEAPQLFPVLYGLFIFHWIRGQLRTARQDADEMLSIGKSLNDSSLVMISHSALGNVDWHIGQNSQAVDHLLKAESLYDEKAHAPLAIVYGQDYGVFTLCYLSFGFWTLGRQSPALKAGEGAVSLARRIKHPFSLCAALALHAPTRIIRGEAQKALEIADECIKIAGEQGFAHWLAKATVYRGWARAKLGELAEGLEEIHRGIAAWRAVGADVALAWHFSLLAEIQTAGCMVEDALKTTDEAFLWIARNGEGQWRSPIHHRRGDAFRAINQTMRADEEYQAAVSIAREQGSKWWELRATLALARLWRDQGKRDEARELLAPVYGWFTEGFDTRDLREAKALLDGLSA